VFARWTNGLYYRGFVTSANSTTVFISYDDGDTITLHKIDSTAVILDHPACYSEVHAGQRVIGFRPGRTRYYPGVVTRKKISDSNNCYQKAVYHVLFDDADKRLQDSLQIRLIPCTASQEFNVKSNSVNPVCSSSSEIKYVWLQMTLQIVLTYFSAVD